MNVLILVGCQEISENHVKTDALRTIVTWDNTQYEYTHVIDKADIEDHIGSIEHLDIQLLNCPDGCPPPIVEGGNAVYSLRNENVENAIALASNSGQYFYFKKINN